MATEITNLHPPLERVLRELGELRSWSGAPREFWPRYLACLGTLCRARKVSLLFKGATQPAQWQTITEWSAQAGPASFLAAFTTQLGEIAEQCVTQNKKLYPLETSGRQTGPWVIATRLKLLRSEEPYVVTCLLPEADETAAREALLRLDLAADTPESYHLNLVARQAKADVEKFATTLDLMVLVNAEKRFLAAALALCNGIATRFQCDRVSLGWLEGGYLRLRAMSRTEKFDRQMGAAQALETAMEEALDQDDEILWPAPEGAEVVSRDHERFVRDQSAGHICSLPLRVDDKARAVLSCERQASPFTQAEVQQLRLCADQVARRLSDLKDRDRWFGARWATAAREKAATWVGPQHTVAKIVAIVITLLLGVLFFVKVPYRVEGNFILRSDEVAYLSAPFDGYISQVLVRPGDKVVKDGVLVTLDTNELTLEEYSAQADLNRFMSEAEKSRAAGALAEMRIAESLAEQATAHLETVRFKLGQAVIRPPFDGVVVEGDLRERLAAPVKQGDALLKVARTENLYIEAELNERDVHEVLNKTAGEIAFVSQPKDTYPVRTVQIEPAAFPKKEQNIFLVRCEPVHGSQDWWRPGMSGLCKFDVEKRTLFWIFTHRTVDFVRMKLWW